MIRVRVEYFAVLREHVGKNAEELRTGQSTAAGLYAELADRYAFPEVGRMKVSINDEFGDWDDPIADGDSIVFIPPVAGG